jgi:hypothetical protein
MGKARPDSLILRGVLTQASHKQVLAFLALTSSMDVTIALCGMGISVQSIQKGYRQERWGRVRNGDKEIVDPGQVPVRSQDTDEEQHPDIFRKG